MDAKNVAVFATQIDFVA